MSRTTLNPQLLSEENRPQSKSVSCMLNLVFRLRNGRTAVAGPQ